MMKDTFTEKISLWLDDELSPVEVTELQTHLASCPACRQTYEAMQHVDRLLRTAAGVMVAPHPGFPQRFEARLARHHSPKPWQIWLTLGALLVGTLLFFGAWGVVGGLTLLSISASVLDVGLFYQWLVVFIESVDSLRVFLNLGALFLKASFITMQQPLFWGCLLVGVATTLLWVRAVQTLSRRAVSTIQLML